MSAEVVKFEERNREALSRILEAVPAGHDAFQMEHFILGMHTYGTPYGKFRQACREVMSRWGNLKNVMLTIDKSKVYIDLYKLKAAKKRTQGGGEEGELEAKVLDMTVRKHEIELDTNERILRQNLDEIEYFFGEALRLEKEIVASGKGQMELLVDYWVNRIKHEIILHTIGGGKGLDAIIEMILALPEPMQRPLLNGVEDMKFRARVAEIGLHEAAVKAIEQPPNILTLKK
jgi:hypothetical protein